MAPYLCKKCCVGTKVKPPKNIRLRFRFINTIFNFYLISVVDGTSKEVSSKETAEETWSSWALVIFLGIALTLLVFAIAIGFLAKMNSTAASQQR